MVLLLVGGLLVLGWRVGVAGRVARANESPVVTTAVVGDVIVGAAAAAEPVAAINAPVLVDIALAPAAIPQTFVGHKPEHSFTIYRVERETRLTASPINSASRQPLCWAATRC